jgi:hypothetical protein
MSDETKAPMAPEGQTSTQAPAAAMPPAQSATKSEQEPEWLPARLERARETERKALLRELGVEDTKDAKAALDAYKAAQEAAKTEQQRVAERMATLEAQAKRAADLEAVVTTKATSEFAALTDSQRVAVEAIAGTDAAARLRAIEALRPTWTAPNATAPKPPIAAPASTAPAAPAPAPTAPAEQNVLATYDRLAKENPAAAAAYRLRNFDAYMKAKQSNASG